MTVANDKDQDPRINQLRRCYAEYVMSAEDYVGYGEAMTYEEWLENLVPIEVIEQTARYYGVSIEHGDGQS